MLFKASVPGKGRRREGRSMPTQECLVQLVQKAHKGPSDEVFALREAVREYELLLVEKNAMIAGLQSALSVQDMPTAAEIPAIPLDADLQPPGSGALVPVEVGIATSEAIAEVSVAVVKTKASEAKSNLVKKLYPKFFAAELCWTQEACAEERVGMLKKKKEK